MAVAIAAAAAVAAAAPLPQGKGMTGLSLRLSLRPCRRGSPLLLRARKKGCAEQKGGKMKRI